MLQVEPTGLGRDAYYGADVSGTYYRHRGEVRETQKT